MRVSEGIRNMFTSILGKQEKADEVIGRIKKMNKLYADRISYQDVRNQPDLEPLALDQSMDMIDVVDDIISCMSVMRLNLSEKIDSLEVVRYGAELTLKNEIEKSEMFLNLKSDTAKDKFKRQKIEEKLYEYDVNLKKFKNYDDMLKILLKDANNARDKINRYHDAIKKMMGQMNAFRD